MTVFSKIIDEETKELDCIECGDTPVVDGYTEIERELGHDGKWYVKGYAPEQPQEEIDQERIIELKNELAETDYVVIKIAEAETIEEQNMLREHYSDIIVNRKHWREEINSLEQ